MLNYLAQRQRPIASGDSHGAACSLCQRPGDLAGAFDEELGQRAQCPVLDGDDPGLLVRGGEFNRQHFDRRTIVVK